MDLIVALYQDDIQNYSEETIEAELLCGKKCGAVEVFTSLHLPETSLKSQIEDLKKTAYMVKRSGMRLCVDIGGETIKRVLDEPFLCRTIQDLELYSMRLDYGHEENQIKNIMAKLGILRFVLNASVLSDKAAGQIIEKIRRCNPKSELTACHNFYPRKETGLTYEFCQKQHEIFHKYEIPVTVCVPSMHKPRGPLYEGLPTIEAQRNYNMERNILELLNGEYCESVMIGDSFSSSDEKDICCRLMTDENVSLRIQVVKGLSKKEREILFEHSHKIRYDSGEYAWRSQTSREMSEAGPKVKPGIIMPRLPYMVTIDNQRYKRYSGELQIMKKKAPQDERVNLVGVVIQEDAWKLSYLEKGISFQFVEEGEPL